MVNLGIDGLVHVETIGRGGFGSVHRASDEVHGRDVAVKILPPILDESARRQFDRERRAMGAVSGHPGIGIVHTSGFTDRGEPYLVMELLSGGSLADRIAAGPLAVDDVVAIGNAMAEALMVAHRAGVLHLDVKPENILFSEFGIPKLVDFGIAALADDEHATSTIRATPAYAAPEILDGRAASAAADVYGLAATMYAALMGSPPYRSGDTALSVIRSVAIDPVPEVRRDDVPAELTRVLRRAMDKEPEVRYATMGEFAAAARAAELAGRSESTASPLASSAPPPPGSSSRAGASQADRDPSHRLGLVLLGVAAALLVVVGGIALTRGGGGDGGGAGAAPGTTEVPTITDDPGPDGPVPPTDANTVPSAPTSTTNDTDPDTTDPDTTDPDTTDPDIPGDEPTTTAIRWTSAVDENGLPTDDIVLVPDEAGRVCVTWDYAGVPTGTPFRVDWYIDGELRPEYGASGTNQGGVSGSFWACATAADTVDPGAYEILWFVEEELAMADSLHVGGGRRLVGLTVVNDAEVAVCRVHLTPPAADHWGADRLRDAVVQSGDSHVIELASGQYHLRVVSCDGADLVVDLDGIDVFGDRSYAVVADGS